MRQIYVNGIIHTMTGRPASAMSVADGKFEFVGGDSDVLNAKSPGDIVIDLEGRAVTPGFIDSHCHMLGTGMLDQRADLRGVKDISGIVARAREHIEKNPVAPGEWIVCRGYDDNLFDVKAPPDREVANMISRENPVLVERVCGHVGTLNDAAISELGITPASDFSGVRADIDADCRLTGIVREAALTFARSRVPKPSGDRLKRVIKSAARTFNKFGVTCVHTDDLDTAPWDALRAAASALSKSGELTLRIREELQAPNMAALREHVARGLRTGAGDAMIGVTCAKILADGSLGGRTAAMLTPYTDTGSRGILCYGDEELRYLVHEAASNGLQVALHAIGDAAAAQCLSAVSALDGSARKLRHRLVHAQFLNEALVNAIYETGMCVDAQPAFTATDWRMIAPALGDAPREHMYCWRRLLERGVNVAGGSDSPVEIPDVVQAMRAAVTRRDSNGQPPEGFVPGQAITPAQALEMYTLNAAYNAFDEHRLGKISPRMEADFVILSDDPLTAELSDIKVLATYVAGKNV